jgi:S1-C subfamily serine protease
VNLFDVAAILLVVVAVILGSRSGAIPQLAGLAGAVLGGTAAILSLPLAETLLADLDPGPRAVAVLAMLLLAVGVGEAVGSGIGQFIALRLRSSLFGALDRVAGAVVGAAQAVLIIWLAGGLLAAGPLERLAMQAQNSTAVRALATVLPPPTEIAVELGRLLDATGLPDVFIGLEPVPAPPVDRPDDPRARAIAAAAEASVVKIRAATCGNQSTGTGFAVAADYVVTNAHVVAGARLIRVEGGSRLRDAEVVLFDPALDVALLHVPGLGVPALRFASRDPARGTEAAALGFPGGDRLTILPAAVSAAYEARGRDIYDENVITRDILELRAEVEPGDSGGPLVLADGTVGGVVFAEARSNDEVGYALTATSVAVRIGPGLGRTGTVDLGPCILR